ncbi:endonuclease/exonuclease/phosphatase family protein [uncultured Paracoccus sp.]|uniref:endonuclease/exonuclease/phosphatase family protein n=1 Tax=uncultured Paracoccus sp. TaxID=189685 RepID=UPI0025F78AD1|nr:endonuclease/exonuclease/phosphatase family protein [uncultured Paracoccus sp.]
MIRFVWMMCLCLAGPVAARDLRIATYDPGLTRPGPGLLLRDIRRADPQVLAAAQVIAAAAPDAILLTGFDWDHDGLALSAFADLLDQAGHPMPHRYASRPNSGMPTRLDLDGDGRRGGADDAQGFGQFSGQNGMAVLSRLPLGPVTDYTAFLWHDLPDSLILATVPPGQRLSSTAHWDVPVLTDQGPLHLLAWSATPPVFDGPEDLNGRRNHDEAAFWLRHLPDAAFVLLGNPNLDLADGEGRAQAMTALLELAQDPQPRGAFQPEQTGVNAGHTGDPALDTAAFDPAGPGNLRVDYAWPAKGLRVTGSGVIWPAPDDSLAQAVEAASNHRLVWVDIDPDSLAEAAR